MINVPPAIVARLGDLTMRYSSRPRSHCRSFGLGCVALLAIAADASAGGIGFRQLTTAHPCAVQRGTKAEIQVRSNFSLDGTYASFFAPAGPTLRLLETKPINAPLEKRGQPGTPHKMELVVPADQLPGLHEYRLATEAGVSSVSHLLVTDHPVVVETAKENGTATEAQAVSIPATICGQCIDMEDVDCYRIAGKKGERLTFQIYAQRLTQAVHDMVGKAGYHMDPILTLTAPNGQIVGMNDNYFGGDALLSVELTQDGEHVLSVRDTRYVGDPRYSYAVEITRGFPALTTFPLVVERGAKTEVDVVSIAARPIVKAVLEPEAKSSTGGSNVELARERLKLNGAAANAMTTNPVAYGVQPFKQLLQLEPIAADKPREVAIPVGINGRLANAGDTHRFAFAAKKDAFYALEVEARRFGLPLDAVLEVFDGAGKKVAEGDDLPLTADVKLTFKAPADGRYVVCVRDLHGRGGIEFTYHLTIASAEPDFEVAGKMYYAMLAPGLSTVWFADITRLNGFDGPIELRVDGLPPGVTQTPVTVPAGMWKVVIILTADKSAKVGAAAVKITGKAELIDKATGSNRTIVRDAEILCELQNQGGGQGYWPVRTSVVGVAKQLDLLKVAASPTELTLKPGGKVELTVTIERSKDYKDPVGLEFTWGYFTSKLGEQLPPGVTLGKSSVTRLSGKTLEGKMSLEATSAALPVERLPIAVMAGVSVSFSIDTKYASNPLFLTIPAEASKPESVAKKTAANK
jgi:hypothetical protein